LTFSWEEDAKWSDLIVVNGEGTLHPQPQALRWIGAVTAIARKYNKPYWVVNSSISCRGDKTEAIFRSFFDQAQYVAIREPVSHREIAQPVSSAISAADCAFLTVPSSQDEALDIVRRAGVKGPFAVVTGSASVDRWPVDHQREVIGYLKSLGLEVLYMHSDRRDTNNLRALNIELPTVSHKDASFQQMAAIQSLAQIVVGGRFHPTILSALVGTPFVAVPSNTHKMTGLMEMLESKELLCDFASLNGLTQKIGKVLKDRDQWSDRLREKAAHAKQYALLNVKRAAFSTLLFSFVVDWSQVA
jgi:polysaccharide pyruvyl transferase WcaK-like protein